MKERYVWRRDGGREGAGVGTNGKSRQWLDKYLQHISHILELLFLGETNNASTVFAWHSAIFWDLLRCRAKSQLGQGRRSCRRKGAARMPMKQEKGGEEREGEENKEIVAGRPSLHSQETRKRLSFPSFFLHRGEYFLFTSSFFPANGQ